MRLDGTTMVENVRTGPAPDEITVHCGSIMSLPHPGDLLSWEGREYVMTRVHALSSSEGGPVVVFRAVGRTAARLGAARREA